MSYYLQTLSKDVAYGIRVLGRSPGFAAAAVLSLALGIGANTAMFSVADAFLLKPFPYLESSSLVAIMEMAPKETFWNQVAPANFLDWKTQNTLCEELAASEWDDVNITSSGDPERIQGFLVTANFFHTLGVDPLIGRDFLPQEEQPGASPVVILSHGLWQRRFGSDPGIVGRNVELNTKSYTVIGVMPKDFDFPMTAELWRPLAMDGKESSLRNSHYLEVIGLLRPGVQISQARAEMQTISQRLEATYPETNKGWGVRVMPIRDFVLSDLTRQYTVMLMVAVMFVLLIACANVAGLGYARSADREREIAVRLALGAGRGRLVMQLLTESLVLALIGAAVSLPLAKAGIHLILGGMPAEVAKYIPGWRAIGLDVRALAFTMGIAVLAAILSGLGPALRSSRTNLNETLKEGGRGSSGGRARQRVRSLLVASEVALALILLVGAGLMSKGVTALLNANHNLNPESVLTMRVDLPESKYKEQPKISSFYQQALAEIETIPGVEGAAVVTRVPYRDAGASTRTISIQGQPAPQPGEQRVARFQTISPNYFSVMHIPILKGREFTGLDGPDALAVAVIGESMASRYWPGEDPLGKSVMVGEPAAGNPWLTIVGIARDVKYGWLDREPEPVVYRSYLQAARSFSDFAIRTSRDPIAIAGALRGKIATVDSGQPVYEIMTLDRVIINSVVGLTYVAVMMTILGGIALFLSAVGIYGLISYSVTERTHEIGIRMALGARAGEVLRLVVARGVLLTSAGLVVGLPVSVLLARVLSSLIFGVSSTDLLTFGGVSLVLTSVAILASLVPARRATRLDPMIALRCE